MVELKRVMTYGTFDLLHYGHVRFLKRARALGSYLIVAVSTDAFNEKKGKTAYQSYENRKEMVEALGCVNQVIPEVCWEQKPEDILRYGIDIIVMGDDWKGDRRFEHLKQYCQVVYLPRTEGISSSQLKRELNLTKPRAVRLMAGEKG